MARFSDTNNQAHAFEVREARKLAKSFESLDTDTFREKLREDRTRLIESELERGVPQEQAAQLKGARAYMDRYDPMSNEALQTNKDLIDGGALVSSDTRIYGRALAMAHHAKDQENMAKTGPVRTTFAQPQSVEKSFVDAEAQKKLTLTDADLAQDILKTQESILTREESQKDWRTREDQIRLKGLRAAHTQRKIDMRDGGAPTMGVAMSKEMLMIMGDPSKLSETASKDRFSLLVATQAGQERDLKRAKSKVADTQRG